jgi:hypothetical protein
MNTALQTSHPRSLDAVLGLNDAVLFTQDNLERALEILADVAGPWSRTSPRSGPAGDQPHHARRGRGHRPPG